VVRRIFWAKHEKISTSGEAVLLLFSILAVLYPLLGLRLSHQIITRDEDVYRMCILLPSILFGVLLFSRYSFFHCLFVKPNGREIFKPY
jgi:hypothetical protein